MHLFRLCCRVAGKSAQRPSPSSSLSLPFFNPRWQVSKKIQIDPVLRGPHEARGRAHSAPRGTNFTSRPFFLQTCTTTRRWTTRTTPMKPMKEVSAVSLGGVTGPLWNASLLPVRYSNDGNARHKAGSAINQVLWSHFFYILVTWVHTISTLEGRIYNCSADLYLYQLNISCRHLETFRIYVSNRCNLIYFPLLVGVLSYSHFGVKINRENLLIRRRPA